MAVYKALQIIKTFSKEDMKGFAKFLSSPYFSTGRDLLPLFSYLRKYHPEYSNGKALEVGSIHKALGGSTSKTNTDLTRKLLSDLFKQAEKYITIKHFMADEQAYSIRKINALNNLETQGLFDKEVLYHDEKNDAGSDFFPAKLFQIAELEEQRQTNLLKNEDFNRKYFEVYTKSPELKLMGTLCQLYRANAAFYTFKKNFNYDSSHTLASSLPQIMNDANLLDKIKETYPEFYPYIEIYRYLYLSHLFPGEINYYHTLKEKFYGTIKRFEHNEAYNLFKYIEGYVILRRDEIENSDAEIASVCKNMLKYGIYTYSGAYMFQVTYQNYCLAFLNNGEISLAESFVKEYNKKLEPKFRNNSLNLMMAHISMKKKEFENALGYLSKVKKDVFYITNTIHSLTTILYYELSYFENTLSHIDTYEKYLRTNPEVSDAMRGRYLNFTRILKKLVGSKTGSEGRNVDEIKYEIEHTKPLYKSDWLLEKVSDLKTNAL